MIQSTRILLAVVVLLALLELALRAMGFPQGNFTFAERGVNGAIHPAWSTVRDLWGPIPFVAHSNNLGYRGSEMVTGVVPAGVSRIAVYGDSFTYGFFVDDEDAYPAVLQSALQKRAEKNVFSVVNFGVPGASIEGVITTHQQIAAHGIAAHYTVVSISANDVKDTTLPYTAMVLPDESVTGEAFPDKLKDRVVAGTIWLLCHSALAEQALTVVLKMQLPQFMAAASKLDASENYDRYDIPKKADTAGNLAEYKSRYDQEWMSTEGPWDAPLLAKNAAYARYLQDLVAHIRSAGSEPVLVYIPSYYQVYSPQYTGALNKALAAMANNMGVPLFDATETLRRHTAEVLYLAPLDMHMSPAGNHVLGEAVAGFMVQQFPRLAR